MDRLSRTPCRFLVGIVACICFCSDARADNIVLVGYWPPTNEMLRPFSTSPVQNPGGWIGQNWNGLGHDVYAFFPSFHPTAIPSTIRLAPRVLSAHPNPISASTIRTPVPISGMSWTCCIRSESSRSVGAVSITAGKSNALRAGTPVGAQHPLIGSPMPTASRSRLRTASIHAVGMPSQPTVMETSCSRNCRSTISSPQRPPLDWPTCSSMRRGPAATICLDSLACMVCITTACITTRMTRLGISRLDTFTSVRACPLPTPDCFRKSR